MEEELRAMRITMEQINEYNSQIVQQNKEIIDRVAMLHEEVTRMRHEGNFEGLNAKVDELLLEIASIKDDNSFKIDPSIIKSTDNSSGSMLQ